PRSGPPRARRASGGFVFEVRHRAHRESMKPLEDFHDEGIEGLLFDLDDTFLTHGVLTREAYESLWDLHDAKMKLIVVTGRPSSWGALAAMQWPIDAATTENGAI